METYAVIWREGSGPLYAGKLEFGEIALRLHGSSPSGALSQHSIPYTEVAEVRIVRSPSDRLNGSPISIAAVNGVGVVFELADLLAELTAKEAATSSRVLVVVPIKRHARERARQLIAAGPPFDPRSIPLQSHRVFLTDREVIFLFEGDDVRGAVEELVRRPGIWKAALAFKDCLAGPPRVADEGYAWVRSGRP